MKWSILVILFFLSMSFTFAQQEKTVTVKESELPPEVLEKIKTSEKIEQYGEWVGLGKELGTAVREALMGTIDAADKFGKTRVGNIVLILVIWKVMGKEILAIIITIPLIIALFIAYLTFIKRMMFGKRVLTSQDGKNKHYMQQFPFADGESRYDATQRRVWAVGWATPIWVVGTSLLLVVMFNVGG